ncbi:hypothetical protein [Rhizobium sp. MHM7A]|uniref:hypothetical protein n=1 Tax=Rhizobium sp. MHM7A TaxID=2583233 RepID=UPI0011069D75|nr:hypothetical protein [Rhizobium sp. MHM7A]TLX12132.1 hypothetical protein FFR93_16320 [Rhizobium sp. MHM7A]
MTTGKCPKCDSHMPYVKFEGIEARQNFGTNAWSSVSFLCPVCSTVIGVQIDPVAIKTDTVNAILNALKKTR